MVVAWALLSACGRPPADGVSPHETAETGRIDTAPPGDSGDSGDTDAETGDSGGDTAPPPRTDADGDGFFAEVDDCDDTRADVHPGAAEGCDAVDADCDGEPLAVGVCGEDQVMTAVGAGSWVGQEPGDAVNAPRFVGDVDGDGLDDVGVYGWLSSGIPESSAHVTAYIVPSGAPPAWETSIFTAATAAWKANPDFAAFVDVRGAGDFDGDGDGDVWLVTNGRTGMNGAAFLMRGPASRWPMGGDVADTADAVWLQAQGGDGFGVGVAADLDLDGDGRADLVVGREGLDAEPALHVLHGRGGSAADWADAADEPWVALSTGGLFASVVAVGDIDGDGLDDLAVGQEDVVSLVPGGALAGLDTADIADWRVATLPNGVDGGRAIASYAAVLAAPGDWTGDGTADLVIGDPADSETLRLAGLVVFVDGAAALEAGGDVWAASTGWWEGGWARAQAGYALGSLPDLDGDGQPELGGGFGVDDSNTDFAAAVLPSTRGAPAPGEVWPGEGALVVVTDTASTLGLGGISGGDLDGDAWPELLLGWDGWNDDRGQAYVLAGWDLPWEEVAWW